jgi:hypothetical protein
VLPRSGGSSSCAKHALDRAQADVRGRARARATVQRAPRGAGRANAPARADSRPLNRDLDPAAPGVKPERERRPTVLEFSHPGIDGPAAASPRTAGDKLESPTRPLTRKRAGSSRRATAPARPADVRCFRLEVLPSRRVARERRRGHDPSTLNDLLAEVDGAAGEGDSGRETGCSGEDDGSGDPAGRNSHGAPRLRRSMWCPGGYLLLIGLVLGFRGLLCKKYRSGLDEGGEFLESRHPRALRCRRDVVSRLL